MIDVQQQNDLAIEEARKKMVENRKKAIRLNLLQVFFFVLIIVGVGGAFVFYVKQQERSLREITSLNEKLRIDNSSLSHANDELLDIIDSLVNSPAILKKIQSKEVVVSDSILTGRDLARKEAKSGFDLLSAGNYAAAQAAFAKSENAYTGYHSSFEVSHLLDSVRLQFNNPAFMESIKQKIAKEYNY